MDNAHDGGFYVPDRRPRWKRLLARLFPRTYFGDPFEPHDPSWAPGSMLTVVVVKVDWRDRLRLLMSGRIEIQVRQRTDVHVNRVQSQSHFTVEPPSFLER